MGGPRGRRMWKGPEEESPPARPSARIADGAQGHRGEGLSPGQLLALVRLGTKTAAVVHSLKNAVHSLRGCAALIEWQLAAGRDPAETIRALRSAVDHAEEFCRAALDRPCDGGGQRLGAVGLSEAEVPQEIDWVRAQLSHAFPLVRVTGSPEPSTTEPPPRAQPAEPPQPAEPRDVGVSQTPVPGAVLREVLMTILLNAAEAMGGAGEIHLETLRPEIQGHARRLEIRVRNHGLGIPDEEFHKLFRPGFTTKPGGSGLGLYLARRMLRRHGGDVRAERAGGGGAVFLVRVPLAGRGYGEAVAAGG